MERFHGAITLGIWLPLVRNIWITCSVVRRLVRARLSWRQERATDPMAFVWWIRRPRRVAIFELDCCRDDGAATVLQESVGETAHRVRFLLLISKRGPKTLLTPAANDCPALQLCRYSVRKIPSLLLYFFCFHLLSPKESRRGNAFFGYSVCASEMVCSEGGTHVLREFRLLSMNFCWEKPSSHADEILSRICTELDALPFPKTSDKSKEP